MNQPIPAPDEIERAQRHWNFRRQIRRLGWGLIGLGAIWLAILPGSAAYPFAVISTLAVSLWLVLFGLFILRGTILTAPRLAYGVLIALFVGGLGLIAVEIRLDPPASGKLPRTQMIPLIMLMGGAGAYLTGLRFARQLGPAPQPATAQWLETAFSGPDSGACTLAITGETVRARRLPETLLTISPATGQIGLVKRGELDFRPATPDKPAELIVQGFPQQIIIEPAEAEQLELWLRG